MDRINRLVGIMLLLQSHRVIRAEDIAEHFDISVRTVYRDLRALEEAGLPVAAEAGKGYSIVEGFRLPPVMFTQEEASALFIGGEFAEQLTDASIREHARSALLKIHTVLPEAQREFIRRLKESTAIHTRTPFDPGELPHSLAEIQDALVKRKVLRTTYYTSSRDSSGIRDIEPLGMIYYGDNWHVIAHCRVRDGVRDFRVDRMHDIAVLEERFPERRDFSLKEYIEGARRRERLQEARVMFSSEAARHTTAKHLFGFVEQVETGDGVEMLFLTSSLTWLARWLLSYGVDVVVLYPEELRLTIVDIARSVAERYVESLSLA